MYTYFIKTPRWARWLFPRWLWRMPAGHKTVYLTFDDGPHPEITPFVLHELARYGAKATFFCIGKNVRAYPSVYAQIREEGHQIGNHPDRHLNGWQHSKEAYLEDIREAARVIPTRLFRPPYGKIRPAQAQAVRKELQLQVVMWDVLSADFDRSLTKDACLKNVLENVVDGSIVVLHDSEKAYPNLSYVLPRVLQVLGAQGYRFEAIEAGFATNN